MPKYRMNKKAQVTLFVVIAIIIIAGVVLVLYFKPKLPLPSKLKPVEDFFLSCVSDIAKEGATILSEQGGYIQLPPFEAGSAYMPFQSRLNFFSSSIPYWFYISGNNIYKTQVPTLREMEAQLANYVAEHIDECSFEAFAEQGYSISTEEVRKISSTVRILEHDIAVELQYPLTIEFADTTKRITKHTARVSSELGSFYKLAKKIYDEEQKNLFLESYTLDVITLNAPTTGNEISCAPLVWSTGEVSSAIKEALQNNIRMIKLKGTYYELTKEENKYFVYDIGESVDKQIIFFYSSLFPTRLEIVPEEDGIMKAMPVGLQEGLGILGFCYVPYHFVYSLAYPVLIQIFDEENNLFQFSLVVVIDKNQARKAEIIETPEQVEAELCKNKLEKISVYTYDPDLEPVEAKIKFKCLNTVCDIGDTAIKGEEAGLTANFPQCINGFVIASAEGYAPTKQQLSTNEPGSVELRMKPYHELAVELDIQLKENESALINFKSEDYSTSLVYPVEKSIKLAEGFYDIDAYLFRQGNIILAEEKTEKCIKVPASGIAGIFGFKKEECYDITIPGQTLTEAVAGGGKTSVSLYEEDLAVSKKIAISIPQFKVPTTAEEMQDNYNLIDTSKLGVSLE